MGGNVSMNGTKAPLPVASRQAVRSGCSAAAPGTTNPASLQSSNRSSLTPGNEFDDIGFRVASVSAAVAAVPEPSSLGLLVIGAMGCVLRRKRG